MRSNPLKFDFQELGGAVGDLGTLLPLMLALILVNGLNATTVLVGVGLFYIAAGVYFRIPMPVQPLKAVSIIAISAGLSASVIGAAGLIMGVILLVLSATNLIGYVMRLFPREVVRGIQLSIGLLLVKKGLELVMGRQAFLSGTVTPAGATGYPFGLFLALAAVVVFLAVRFASFKGRRRIPSSLALLVFGVGAGVLFGPLPGPVTPLHVFPEIVMPSGRDFWLALTILVIPQLPLTLGNAVAGMSDTATVYFGENARRAGPRALTTSMGLANVAAGLLGAMPMCHGSGGLTAHHKLGARTGGASVIIGALLLLLGVIFGGAALSYFSLVPLSVLGVLLVIVGIYHGLLLRDVVRLNQILVASLVAAVTLVFGNLALGFVSGLALYLLLKRTPLGALPWSFDEKLAGLRAALRANPVLSRMHRVLVSFGEVGPDTPMR